MANGNDARKAITEAVIEVDNAWEERYALFFAKEVLAALNRAGWRLVKVGEGDL